MVARRDLSLLLLTMHAPWACWALADGGDMLTGRGLGPGCRMRRSRLERFLWGISLSLQHNFCSRSNHTRYCQHWVWVKVISPAWCGRAKKWGVGPLHCTTNVKQSLSAAHVKYAGYFWWRKYHPYTQSEERVPQMWFSWNQSWASLLLQNLDPWLWTQDMTLMCETGKLVVCSPETKPREAPTATF